MKKEKLESPKLYKLSYFMNFPIVSIVVTAKNEEKNIGKCLEEI